MYGWPREWTDGQTDRWVEGWMPGITHASCHLDHLQESFLADCLDEEFAIPINLA